MWCISMPRTIFHATLIPVVAVAMVVAAGCGVSGPETAEVVGLVTVDGAPVLGASVTFVPSGFSGSPSYGETDATGRYRLAFTRRRFGALPGIHEVRIERLRTSAEEEAELRRDTGSALSRPVPARYSKPGALTAEVARGRNTIDFELKTN